MYKKNSKEDKGVLALFIVTLLIATVIMVGFLCVCFHYTGLNTELLERGMEASGFYYTMSASFFLFSIMAAMGGYYVLNRLLYWLGRQTITEWILAHTMLNP